MSPAKSTAKSKKSKGFTAEERAAMKERAKELKAEAEKADGESALLAKIAEMKGNDRAMAKRLHAIVKANAPELSPKTWYGMPAYARDGKVVCFFKSAEKFKSRYATLGLRRGGEPRRRRHVADLLRPEEVDRRRREEDRRAREEGGELRARSGSVPRRPVLLVGPFELLHLLVRQLQADDLGLSEQLGAADYAGARWPEVSANLRLRPEAPSRLTGARARADVWCQVASTAATVRLDRLVEEAADRGGGWAPRKPVTGSPSRKTATVGMLWMPNWAARPARRRRRSWRVELAVALADLGFDRGAEHGGQGPHQAAQKSTTTGSSCERSMTSC